MKRLEQSLAIAALFALSLNACSGVTNGNSFVPDQNQVPLANLGKATFSVGTATLQDGTTGLNVVAYLRTANGSTAYLVNTPSISGPAGFTVPTSAQTANGAGGSGADGGTATISATGQTATPPPAGTTFGTAGGLFGGGFGPFNSTQSSSNFYPGNSNPSAGVPAFLTPFYRTPSGGNTPTDPRIFLLGPPAPGVPQFTNITWPLNFAGYLPGFTAFGATPVTGTYNLSVVVTAANAAGTTVAASANLSSVAALPAQPSPTLTKDGAGGGTVNVTVPVDPRIVETLVFIHDTSTNAFYTVGPLTGTGALTGALPDLLGPCPASGPGCNAPTIQTGDTFEMTAISFDYSDFEATQPGNTSQQPTVAGPGGQSDLSISPATISTY